MKSSIELKEMRNDIIDSLEVIKETATAEERDLTSEENDNMDSLLKNADELAAKIERAEKVETEIRNNINETLELNDEMLSFLEENFECIKDHGEAKVDIIKVFDTKYSKKMTFKDISTEIKRRWSCVVYFKDKMISGKTFV